MARSTGNGSSVKKQTVTGILLILIPLLLVGAIFLLSPLLRELLELMPPCVFRKHTGLLCPGCGNTRAVTALVSFDVITSVKYNPVPLAALICGVLGYAQLVFKAFGKGVRLLPRRLSFWLILIFIFLAYSVARNLIPWLSIA